MSRLVDLRIFELLAARLCHELISPIGAIANGVELLGEDDPDFVRDATVLIGQSAKKAGQRLQFYRFAYGSSATGEAADPRELVGGLLDGGKLSCVWRAEALALPVEWQKMACNMIVLAAEALPRGGTVTVAAGPRTSRRVEIVGVGEAVNVTGEARAALALEIEPADLTARTVQGYFTACLAEALGVALALSEPGPGQLTLGAGP